MWFAGLEEHFGVVMTVLGGVLSAFVAVLWSDYKATKKKVTDIEKNYLTRFDEVKDEIRRSERSILESFSKFQVEMARTYIRKGECALFHTLNTKPLEE